MHTRHAVSLAAALAFVVLALGSGEGDSSSDTSTMPSTVPAPTPTSAADEPEPAPEAAPSGGFPTTDDGQCCCDFMEADQAVQRFQPVDACQGMAGVCISELAPCGEAAKQVEEQAEKCCCEATETIVDGASDCSGTCHDFFVEGDTPGSCQF